MSAYTNTETCLVFRVPGHREAIFGPIPFGISPWARLGQVARSSRLLFLYGGGSSQCRRPRLMTKQTGNCINAIQILLISSRHTLKTVNAPSSHWPSPFPSPSVAMESSQIGHRYSDARKLQYALAQTLRNSTHR